MAILTSKILKMTIEMRELMVQLAPVLLGGMNAPLPLDNGIITTIVEADQEAPYQHRHPSWILWRNLLFK